MPVLISPCAPPFADGVWTPAVEASTVRRAESDRSGLPEMSIVKIGDHAFTWELRRFGGVLLERGIEVFDSETLARADGEAVLATLCVPQNLPRSTRAKSF